MAVQLMFLYHGVRT